MENTNINRFSQLSLKNGKVLSNRVVIPPMASETADVQGFVTEKTLAHYSSLGESKVGFIFVEYSFIHVSGKSEENQLGIYSDDHLVGLTSLAKEIHSSKALAGIQLTHAGGKSESRFSVGPLYSPSGVVVPVKDKVLENPIEMNSEDISHWKKWFLDAATRASKAHFDLVELHAAHGYGLNQWLSPITNKRNDGYGGSVTKNARLLLEIIQEIKENHPHLLISVRIPGQDFLEGGLISEDCILIAKLIQEAGVDLINVSSGIGGWRRPGTRNGEGYLVEEAAIIQSHVTIPVIGVGGIESGSYIDHLLKNNKISLAAVGRAILKNPKGWGHTMLNVFAFLIQI